MGVPPKIGRLIIYGGELTGMPMSSQQLSSLKSDKVVLSEGFLKSPTKY